MCRSIVRAVVVVVVSSLSLRCQTLSVRASVVSQVQVGWTDDEVIAKLGEPDGRNLDAETTDYWVEGSRLCRFTFRGAKVAAIEILPDPGAGSRRSEKNARFASALVSTTDEIARAIVDA